MWQATQQIELLREHYAFFEEFFQETLLEDLPVLRKFASVEEQNLWFEKSDKPSLQPYLDTQLLTKNPFQHVKATYGFGKVKDTGRVSVDKLLQLVMGYLEEQQYLLKETFQYNELTVLSSGYSYKDYTADTIVFCEGYGLTHNPYFNHLPLVGNKGELVTIYAEDLNVDAVVKSGCFIIPLGNHHYKIGATYNHVDKDQKPSERAKTELIEKLEKLINCTYTVVNHQAAIRPTTKDRRPLIGSHPKYKNMYVLNGLGTRGVMIGPFAAKNLFEHIEKQETLHPEMDIARFA